MDLLQAPFQYFGGKRRVADEVWRRFGRVKNYVEPFFGSGAVLLARPGPPGTETANDIDAYVSNFWRAVQHDPDQVASLMDWPVNEVDKEARHKWLVQKHRKGEHRHRMMNDPEYFDVKIAAWWCWGLCTWIGGGWCDGEWEGEGEFSEQRPELRHNGRGVHKQLPHLCGAGQGVNRKRTGIDGCTNGSKVHAQLPHLGSLRGVLRTCADLHVSNQGECDRRGDILKRWMRSLSDRLRNVRVCCGDWGRVCTDTPTIHNGLTAVFLDPPYADTAERTKVYSNDDMQVAHAVRDWAIQRGVDPRFRIALCGYEGEHRMPKSWDKYKWHATGGFGNTGKKEEDSQAKKNRHKERIWFSSHCLRDHVAPGLLDLA